MSKMVRILAVIPARGGSKSIPRKNIKPFLDEPLIAWIIREAKKSELISRIVVSTDDAEIADVARFYGAEVPFLRPAEISQDLSHSVDALSHAVDWLEKNERWVPDAVVLLPPTAPLTTVEDIDRGIKLLLESLDADSVRPIIESPKHPYKTFGIEGEYIKPFFPKEITGFDEPFDMPRQILPKAYVYSGAMQIIWLKTLRQLKSLSGKKMRYFLMKSENSINIDSAIDFYLAEILMAKRLGRKHVDL